MLSRIPPLFSPQRSMFRIRRLLVLPLLAVALPAAAQPERDPGTPIGLGATLEGRLDIRDPKEAGRYVDTYLYQGTEGETIVITLHSTEFDAQVYIGEVSHEGCTGVTVPTEIDGPEIRRTTLTVEQSGPYHIHVGSMGRRRTGRYTIAVERGTPAATAGLLRH